MTWLVASIIGAFLGAHTSQVIERGMGHEAASFVALIGAAVVGLFWAREKGA